MFKILCFLLALTALNFSSKLVHGQELEAGVDFAQQDPVISDLYQKGPYLIYDCFSKHWVCSEKKEFRRCVDWREEGYEHKNENLGCAYFIPYNSRSECEEKQIEMINTGMGDRFCLHQMFRKHHMNL